MHKTNNILFINKLIGENQVLPGVGELIEEVQVEGTFPDGTKLVGVNNQVRWPKYTIYM